MKKIIGFLICFALYGSGFAQGLIDEHFFGEFSGDIELIDHKTRRVAVEISPTKQGFNINWETTSISSKGQSKSKVYSINFTKSPREGIFTAAMKNNLFGGSQALDPMQGEPFFWAKIKANTLSVFSLLISDNGEYEIQRYDRTLISDNELRLDFTLIQEGVIVKTISGKLNRK